MIARIFAMTLAVATAAWLAATMGMAALSLDGRIEKAGDGTIAIKDKAGTVQEFVVETGAKITLDGKVVRLDDLMTGNMATVVTESKGDQTRAVMITARSKLLPAMD